jgi:GntR family transcriptional regulator
MFLLNLQSKLPINEQIQTEILRFIEAGVLRPGERLPSVRQLATENGINPNTVARAYAELEKQGAVYNIPKKGVYVAERTGPKPDPIMESLRRIRDSGISKEELLNKVEAVYGEEYDVKS